MIELTDLARSFLVGSQTVHALDHIDLTIPDGDYVTIMGPSGSGKSTLLNIIGCLDRPSEGSYRLDGRDVAGMDERALSAIRGRRIGFVFQSFHLVNRLTAAGNVELPMVFAGVAPAERRRRAAEALDAVDLTDRAEHRPEQLSGGERQRVAIARAVVMGPSVLLADEPTGNLDTASGDEVIALLERMNADGLTLLVVTHDEELGRRARRRVRLRDGKIDRIDVPGGAVRGIDVLRYAAGAFRGHRLRTGLSLLGVAIGVAAVIILTSLGEGARRYVVGQFASLGSNLVIVLPGKTETTGAMPIMGGVPNDLTLDDMEAVRRRVPQARHIAPVVLGTAMARAGERAREVMVIGTTAEMLEVRKISVGIGRFLPAGDHDRAARVCVIGAKLQRELFADRNPLGAVLRLGEERFRVIGVMAPQGESIGMNIDELVQIPAHLAMRMYDRTSMFRMLVEVRTPEEIAAAETRILAVLTERHDGVEDVTTVTQDAVASSFGRILAILTAALGGIAAISLSVAGIGIMNVMLVSVSERTSEIGLLMALGANRRQILGVFLVEAAVLSSIGGGIGLAAGFGVAAAIGAVYPSFPVVAPMWAVQGAVAVSIAVGVVFGALPARRAARLDPVAALARR